MGNRERDTYRRALVDIAESHVPWVNPRGYYRQLLDQAVMIAREALEKGEYSDAN